MIPVSVPTILAKTYPGQTVAVLRAATEHLHRALHQHPLIAELLARPSFDSYRAVLEGFQRFYAEAEPMIVECSRKFGCARQYPLVIRSRWLIADLESLGCECDRPVSLNDEHPVAKLNSVAELVGTLYVINGSALGGATILRKVSALLSIEHSCRFFTGEGDKTGETWNAFQEFCEEACSSEEAKRDAIVAAKHTFTSIERCLASP